MKFQGLSTKPLRFVKVKKLNRVGSQRKSLRTAEKTDLNLCGPLRKPLHFSAVNTFQAMTNCEILKIKSSSDPEATKKIS